MVNQIAIRDNGNQLSTTVSVIKGWLEDVIVQNVLWKWLCLIFYCFLKIQFTILYSFKHLCSWHTIHCTYHHYGSSHMVFLIVNWGIAQWIIPFWCLVFRSSVPCYLFQFAWPVYSSTAWVRILCENSNPYGHSTSSLLKVTVSLHIQNLFKSLPRV